MILWVDHAVVLLHGGLMSGGSGGLDQPSSTWGLAAGWDLSSGCRPMPASLRGCSGLLTARWLASKTVSPEDTL